MKHVDAFCPKCHSYNFEIYGIPEIGLMIIRCEHCLHKFDNIVVIRNLHLDSDSRGENRS